MKRYLLTGLLLALGWTMLSSAALAQKAPKIKDTVTFATTWEGAVEEAKLLNLPIVVHSHGFY